MFINVLLLGAGLVLAVGGAAAVRTRIRLGRAGERVTGTVIEWAEGSSDVDHGQFYNAVVSFRTRAGREMTVTLPDYAGPGSAGMVNEPVEVLYDPDRPGVVRAGSPAEHRGMTLVAALVVVAGVVLVCYALIRMTG